MHGERTQLMGAFLKGIEHSIERPAQYDDLAAAHDRTAAHGGIPFSDLERHTRHVPEAVRETQASQPV